MASVSRPRRRGRRRFETEP